jgi:hypothetical protein
VLQTAVHLVRQASSCRGPAPCASSRCCHLLPMLCYGCLENRPCKSAAPEAQDTAAVGGDLLVLAGTCRYFSASPACRCLQEHVVPLQVAAKGLEDTTGSCSYLQVPGTTRGTCRYFNTLRCRSLMESPTGAPSRYLWDSRQPIK